jgi:hypothetical protein
MLRELLMEISPCRHARAPGLLRARRGANGDVSRQVIEKMSFGRGSWIRTNDLQYPKLPRYQAALYPDLPE